MVNKTNEILPRVLFGITFCDQQEDLYIIPLGKDLSERVLIGKAGSTDKQQWDEYVKITTQQESTKRAIIVVETYLDGADNKTNLLMLLTTTHHDCGLSYLDANFHNDREKLMTAFVSVLDQNNMLDGKQPVMLAKPMDVLNINSKIVGCEDGKN